MSLLFLRRRAGVRFLGNLSPLSGFPCRKTDEAPTSGGHSTRRMTASEGRTLKVSHLTARSHSP